MTEWETVVPPKAEDEDTAMVLGTGAGARYTTSLATLLTITETTQITTTMDGSTRTRDLRFKNVKSREGRGGGGLYRGALLGAAKHSEMDLHHMSSYSYHSAPGKKIHMAKCPAMLL